MAEIVYLTLEQVLYIHKRIQDKTGGMRGVRDLGALQAAIARPQATFADQELYPDLFTKAAAIMHSIVLNHPFLDANKRVGLTAGALFLNINGYLLKAQQSALEQVILELARGELDIDDLARWLSVHSEKK